MFHCLTESRLPTTLVAIFHFEGKQAYSLSRYGSFVILAGKALGPGWALASCCPLAPGGKGECLHLGEEPVRAALSTLGSFDKHVPLAQKCQRRGGCLLWGLYLFLSHIGNQCLVASFRCPVSHPGVETPSCEGKIARAV